MFHNLPACTEKDVSYSLFENAGIFYFGPQPLVVAKFFQKYILVVSVNRGYQYLSDAFGTMKNIVPSRSYNWLEVSATV